MHNSFVSIIIPVLNAEKYMEKCLQALRKVDYPKDMIEVIVVDNGSIDKTPVIAQKLNTKLFVKKNCTISALRNAGVAQSKGDVIAFIDADCIAPATWLRSALKLFERPSVGAAGCWYALPKEPVFWEKVWDLQMGTRRQIRGPISWVPSGNLIVKRPVFEAIKGFNEALTTAEDVDICQRIIENGKEVYSHPALAVEHLGNPKTVRDFFFKELWRGKGVIQNYAKGIAKIAFLKAMGFAVVYAALWIGMVVGILLGIANDYWLLAVLSILGFAGIPFLLALKVMVKGRRMRYLRDFFPLMFLYFIFGVSRALSLYDVTLLSGLFKRREGR